MFKRTVAVIELVAVAGFVVMVALLLVKQPTKNLTALPAPTSASSGQSGGPAAAPDGAKLYRSNCAGCHGGDGGGGIGPQLRDGAVTSAFKDATSQVDFVKRGAGGMPAFANRLSDAEIQAVVEFTRTTLQGK